MATAAARPRRPFRLLPQTAGGWAALGLFAISLVLLFGRLVLTPLLQLPLNFLMVFGSTVGAGVVALLAVVLQRERGLSVSLVLAVGLLAAAFLIAESFTGGPGGPIPSTTLGEGDDGRTVSVQQGAQILVTLPGNASTGYTWEASISDPSVLAQTDSIFKPTGKQLGSDGTYFIWFDTRAPGKTDLTLVYHRTWEVGVAPLKTYRVTIEAR